MSKGVSPVIASILIVLVAVSLLSGYLVWSNRVFSDVTSAAGEDVERTSEELFSELRIEGLNGQVVTVKNTGASELSASALDVFIDGVPVERAADFDVLEPDDLGELTLRGLWRAGRGEHTLRVSAGSFEDTESINVEPARGVVGDWRFEEGTGTTVADSSGNGNDGKLMNDTFVCEGGECPVRNPDTPLASSEFSILLDGVNDYIEVPHSPLLNPGTGDFTIETWIRLDDVEGGDGYIISKDQDPGDFYFLMAGAKPQLKFEDSSGNVIILLRAAEDVIEPDRWHHVVVSVNRGSERDSLIYVDEDPVELSNQTIADDTTPIDNTVDLWIGERDDKNFNGSMDNVLMFRRAYTPEELYVLSPA